MLRNILPAVCFVLLGSLAAHAQHNRTFTHWTAQAIALPALPTRQWLPQLYISTHSNPSPSAQQSVMHWPAQLPEAFFCRMELKMETKARLPVKFRLGSVDYVDFLEGKTEAWRYPPQLK